jgi:curved DNA-binding protein CbpA
VSVGETNVLAAGVLPGLLRSLYVQRRTGRLRFERADEHCVLRLSKGHIVYGEASEPDLHMGHVLVGLEMLSADNRARAMELAEREHMKLGAALLALGLADLELLEEFLSFHVIAIIGHVLRWTSGSYAFAEGDPGLVEGVDFPLKMTMGELFLEAVRRIADRAVIQFGIGDVDRVLLPSTDPLVRFQRVPLNPTDAFVLSRVDGILTAREIVAITPLAAEAVERSLLSLLCTGIVEFAPQKLHAEPPGSPQFLRQEILDAFRGLQTRDHFQVLGVTEAASDADVKAAYFRLAKRYHPDVHHHLSLADLVDKVEEVFLRLGEAYQAVGQEKARKAYAATLHGPKPAPAAAAPPDAAQEGPRRDAAPRVDEMFERGKERFNDGKYWEALAIFGEVVPLADGRLKAQARLFMAKAYLRYPEREREAEHELLEVTQAQPDNFEPFYLLGSFYQRKGLSTRAEAMFRRVLELKPNHRETIAQLQTLSSEPASGEGAGLLKRFFRKP